MKPLSTLILATALAIPATHYASSAEGQLRTPRCSVDQGQQYLAQGRYDQAIREFTCVITGDPASVEGYRGRMEAELLLGHYSDALRDFSRVTAYVLPVHPDAHELIFAYYENQLATAPDDIAALTAASFMHWAGFQYLQAIHGLNHLLEVQPNSVFGNLFRGSSRVLKGVANDKGLADLERALALAPQSADVHFVAADAFTYGWRDLNRAFAEASLALAGGLDTPRVHAILATAYFAFGDEASAAAHLLRHFELITTELLATAPLGPGSSLTVSLAPGRVYEIPVPVVAGQALSISTSSRDYWDSIAVLLAPDGTPVTGSDDANAYFAAFDWVAPTTGNYRLRVTFFESVNSGDLLVERK